ncbi:hypothetical protein S1361_12155 [Streptomyces cyanogenus]|uniref:Uncharacterized protein n=1 Tax=Streptomyces cyanogenus TaxID=80860 RepID=A0ABX7TMZ2_STRCY|nr:hypothetical protein S1361_12155 [Streptomyces cyanogenus]
MPRHTRVAGRALRGARPGRAGDRTGVAVAGPARSLPGSPPPGAPGGATAWTAPPPAPACPSPLSVVPPPVVPVVRNQERVTVVSGPDAGRGTRPYPLRARPHPARRDLTR